MLAAACSVATLGQYQCASRTWGGRTCWRRRSRSTRVTAGVADGALILDVRGSGPSPASRASCSPQRARSAAKNDYWLPTTGAVEADGSFTSDGAIRSGHRRGRRAAGRWALGVHHRRARPRRPSVRPPTALPPCPGCRARSIAGRAIVAEATGPSLIVDVGATKSSIVGRVPPADVEIAEIGPRHPSACAVAPGRQLGRPGRAGTAVAGQVRAAGSHRRRRRGQLARVLPERAGRPLASVQPRSAAPPRRCRSSSRSPPRGR